MNIDAAVELAQYPEGTVLLDRDGTAWQKTTIGWCSAWLSSPTPIYELGPWTVIHTPDGYAIRDHEHLADTVAGSLIIDAAGDVYRNPGAHDIWWQCMSDSDGVPLESIALPACILYTPQIEETR